MSNSVFRIFTGLAAFAFFTACNKNLPGIPAYVKVDEAQLSVSAGQGSASSNINAVWLSSGSTDFGIYEIPNISDTTMCVAPVLLSGNHMFLLQAVIKQNGIAATRAVYPFYLPDTAWLDLAELDTAEINPVFKYKPSTVFAMNEDFETGNAFGDMTRCTNAGEVFEGSGCGKISLNNTTDSVIESKMIAGIGIPVTANTYLELNYRNPGQGFKLNFEAVNGSDIIRSEIITITARDYWNKIYIDLSSAIGQLSGTETYKFYLTASLTDGMSSSNIYIDNFKVVHF